MTLSPAAQAVLTSLNTAPAHTRLMAAAVLCAAVEQVLPENGPFHHGPSATRLAEHVRAELLAIAAELESAPMTWTASLLPDDALPPDSLVGRMLNPEPECDDVPLVFPEDGSSLPVLTEEVLEPQPLWRVMVNARCRMPLGVEYPHEIAAAEIEALRDHMLPTQPEPALGPCLDQRRAIWRRDNQIREYLTEQARIARERQS